MLMLTIFVLASSLAPTVAHADTVLAGDHVVQGGLCAGLGCLNDEDFPGPQLVSKEADTPGVSMVQTNTGGFAPYTWDVAGNETNFFIRDVTNSSRLIFRAFPGTVSNQLQLKAFGVSDFAGIVRQTAPRTGQVVDDGSTLLPALRTLQFERYQLPDTTATHFGPTDVSFNTAFGLGVAEPLALSDIAGVALASVKQLDARVSALELTPGPAGPAGPAGAAGAAGGAGADGAAGTNTPRAATRDQLNQANRRILALERQNATQTKMLLRLQRQVNALS
ncbi:MAG: hypothetical protein JWM25_362 [Thermoleophilia bacterium]|nr:hypothetical protein [Thermoleophilia bacterium]